MAKIDFTKVEQNLSGALQSWFQKKLVEGRTVCYPGAFSFYGVEFAKPRPQDSVIHALAHWGEETADTEEAILEETLSSYSPITAVEPAPIPEKEELPIAPLFVLRQRLLWFIRKRVVNIYKLLGTSKEEIVAFRKKRELTPDDLKRVKDLLNKTNDVHERLMKKLGIETNDALVASEKKRHLTKRFNIRETWLPL